MARLQTGLLDNADDALDGLRLSDVASQAGCTERRIRHLITLGLVDGARTVGARSSYCQGHVNQAQAVMKVCEAGPYSLRELAWLNSQDAVLELNLMESLKPLDCLIAIARLRFSKPDCDAFDFGSTPRSPFQGRALKAIERAIEKSIASERQIIDGARKALAMAKRIRD